MELRKTKILSLDNQISQENVLIKELSIALLWEIEEGIKNDDLKTIIKECTNIGETMFKQMGVNAAKKIYDEIIALTYGSTTLTNQDGEEVTERSRSKKKTK